MPEDVTSDNLPCQANAFETFVKTSDDPFIQVIYRFLCLAHMVNNVFKDVVKKSDDLSNYIKEILEIVKLLRKPQAVDFLQSKCPSLSRTRWLYIVDILL